VTVTFTSCNAATPPNRFDTPSMVSIGRCAPGRFEVRSSKFEG
jgi:hypothetical protein